LQKSVNDLRLKKSKELIIPDKICNALLMSRFHGKTIRSGLVVIHVEHGEVRLEPISRAIIRVQALVRKYIPETVNLVEELSTERRAAAERA
jgi:hypothetical protein